MGVHVHVECIYSDQEQRPEIASLPPHKTDQQKSTKINNKTKHNNTPKTRKTYVLRFCKVWLDE